MSWQQLLICELFELENSSAPSLSSSLFYFLHYSLWSVLVSSSLASCVRVVLATVVSLQESHTVSCAFSTSHVFRRAWQRARRALTTPSSPVRALARVLWRHVGCLRAHPLHLKGDKHRPSIRQGRRRSMRRNWRQGQRSWQAVTLNGLPYWRDLMTSQASDFVSELEQDE